MFTHPHRRSFLGTAAASTSLGFLTGLRPVSASESRLDPKLVSLDAGIEPLVKLLEESSREKVLEEVGSQIKDGLNYRELLAALFLAGVRNVQPRPNVGFKFHAVLMVNSAHLASQAAPDRERWLPLLWAVDRFKDGQAATKKESGWRMKPVDEMKLPPARKARERFIEAMDNWDEEAADVATAALARSASTNDLFELYVKYGSRDFRDIGHKAIYVANAFRTLQAIGWHHAEPVLRSLTYAILQHEGDNPAKRDGAPDKPGRRNTALARTIRPDWLEGKANPDAIADILAIARLGSDEDAADKVVSLLKTTSPQTVWDGLFLSAAELLMRQPGIVALHSLTTLNALRYSFDSTASDETRRLLVLQAASFLTLFRKAMVERGKMGDLRIDQQLAERPDDPIVPKLEEVFATLSKDKLAAAQGAFTYLKSYQGAGRGLINHARRLIFLKGTDAHDYKFSAAVMEDYSHLSAGVRDQFLAASLYWLKGSEGPDSPLVKRIHTAIG